MDIWFAFAAGILSFASACILPLIPSYIAVITGVAITDLDGVHAKRFKMISRSIAFVIGLIIPLMLIGMGATAVGAIFNPAVSTFLSQFLGFIVIIFGLYLLGLLNIQLFQREVRFHRFFQKRGGLLTVALMGMAFGFGWTPCIGPMLSSILIMAADSQTIWQGSGLLFIYGLGLGLPFIVIAFIGSSSLKFLKFLQKHIKVLSIISGILLIILGLLLVTGNMAYITPTI
ncbi:cytochrome c biogenesis protein CcdA [Salipaludibacillus keqinensis]|jgi:cytochrome c-type biogenesis protein|uniref:Cytochrome c biogenesis protein CcdA n=1 Tax=Salipaludibacillus keqinensis TaxID=2045207 RepID=A0A323TVM3_9BACI|nr:cytochrome c biogenesis protein CcdA [Salipaludibacillus keqinensis]PYZ93575.1 cytochrome c biogenesis protein CcdA [Salipaludibacillus keqinensis]